MCKLKIIFLGLFAVASLCLAVVAEAIDFKVKDWWLVSMQYGQNGNFCDHGHQGYDYLEDEFEARSRVRIQLDAVASENLSGQVYFEIGKFIWGKGVGEQSGAPLGADARNVIKLKRAFIEWTIPDTRPRVKMGIQAFRTPYLALDGPIVMTADGAGVIASYTVNDNIALTGFWMRPYNDNYVSPPDKNESGFMDNLDVGGLFIPLRFDGWDVTPRAMYCAIGPNTFKNNAGQFGNRVSQPDGNYFFSGMFPLLGDNPKINDRKSSAYANIWRAGATGELTMFDPWRFAWEFTYGSVSWAGDEPLDRKGWMGAAILEYKLDWGMPGLYGWYASGDDDDLSNGSERLPYLVNDFGVSGFSDTFAGLDINDMEQDRVIDNTLIGTWGVGLRLKNVSFIRNLRHTPHGSLWGGTNS